MSAGASAPGVTGEEQTARWVREMFGRVAHRYDFLNHFLSFQLDRYWRARTVRRVRHILANPESAVADLCCGSGDLLLKLERLGAGTVMGVDFCHQMLAEAGRKIRRRRAGALLVEGDALRLPLPAGCLDVITVAFGFRNLANYRAGLVEMLRVLKPGGTAAILEFSQPTRRVLVRIYGAYSRRAVPLLGRLVSGSRQAYSYLPESVNRFPAANELARDMRAAGFIGVDFELITGGIVALHTGEAPR